LKYAHGKVLDVRVQSDSYQIKAEGLRADFARDDLVPFLDVVATMNNGQVSLFMLNRDLQQERELVIEWQDGIPARVINCETITGPDLKAVNTFQEPNIVRPRPLDPPKAGAKMAFKLPPRSYTVTTISLA